MRDVILIHLVLEYSPLFYLCVPATIMISFGTFNKPL
jgi:hypothetical protein